MTGIAPPPGPSVSRAVQRRRQLRLARIRARASLRVSLATSPRRRQRADVCTAADTLTALGVRVVVVPPAAAWPRSGRFVLPDATGWLADLALVTAALDRGGAGEGPPVICPVSIGFRTAGGTLAPEQVPTRIADVVAADGLVIEVRCLPAEAAIR